MPLKIELKPNERVILGDCVVTNGNRRTRLLIEGTVPILREKDTMSRSGADTSAKRIYLTVQLMYISKRSPEHHERYIRLARDMMKAVPGSAPYVQRITNLILTGELYKALRETRKLIAYERKLLAMRYAAEAYARTALNTAAPREVEAQLLLKAAAQLQEVHDAWKETAPDLRQALLFNRRLWGVLLDAVQHEGNRLPIVVRDNLTKLGAFVMGETFALMTKPKRMHLKSIIKINRGIAAGLRGRA